MDQTIRECDQCSYIINEGSANERRCSRRTCLYANKCWQHTKKSDYVQIRPSAIKDAGLGLFWTGPNLHNPTNALRKLFTYARLEDFVSEAEMNTRYPGDTQAVYAWCRNEHDCFDSRSTQSGLGRWINDKAKGRNSHLNKVVIDKFEGDDVPWI